MSAVCKSCGKELVKGSVYAVRTKKRQICLTCRLKEDKTIPTEMVKEIMDRYEKRLDDSRDDVHSESQMNIDLRSELREMKLRHGHEIGILTGQLMAAQQTECTSNSYTDNNYNIYADINMDHVINLTSFSPDKLYEAMERYPFLKAFFTMQDLGKIKR